MIKGYCAKVGLEGIGTVWIAGANRGICRVEFGEDRRRFLAGLPKDVEWVEDRARFRGIVAKLKKFAAGKRANLGKNLDILSGTPFQRCAWKKIATIPWGETRSYAWLARAIGKPSAFRAVANACGKNPVPIIIPCHRVISSDGTIGGFSSGIKLKRIFLKLEGVRF
ncbi:MAG: methylated-DNA--[protein]-cysteine S-methyltransferase [Pseudomonadota bacterium]